MAVDVSDVFVVDTTEVPEELPSDEADPETSVGEDDVVDVDNVTSGNEDVDTTNDLDVEEEGVDSDEVVPEETPVETPEETPTETPEGTDNEDEDEETPTEMPVEEIGNEEEDEVVEEHLSDVAEVESEADQDVGEAEENDVSVLDEISPETEKDVDDTDTTEETADVEDSENSPPVDNGEPAVEERKVVSLKAFIGMSREAFT
eukprot:78268-Rhodomonas_salina.1